MIFVPSVHGHGSIDGDDFSLSVNPIAKGELASVPVSLADSGDPVGDIGSGELENPIAQIDESSSSLSGEDSIVFNLLKSS
jgi:hypothetical protein